MKSRARIVITKFGASRARGPILALIAGISGARSLVACEREGSALEPPPSEKPTLARAADFSLPDLAGRMHSLSEYQARGPVLLVFFTTWCSYCRREIPELKTAYREFQDKGLQVVAINAAFSDTLENSRAYALEHRLPYAVLFDTSGAAVRDYGVRTVPRYFLIEQNGEISAKATRVSKIRLGERLSAIGSSKAPASKRIGAAKDGVPTSGGATPLSR